MSTEKRRYELRRRAETMAETRERITVAAVELHGTIGPARTTVSALAEHAGVQRQTVYRHFPTDEDLYAACSQHFAALNPPPDVAAWRTVKDPRERLGVGLDELYAFYERAGYMWANVMRDEAFVPAAARQFAHFRAYLDEAAAALAAGWGVSGRRRKLLVAAARHAVDFTTWQSLGQLRRAEAIELASAMVVQAASP